MRRQASPLPPNYSSFIGRANVAADVGFGGSVKAGAINSTVPTGYLWVKIENNGDSINQTFRVQIHDNDTVEDLKDIILHKLNSSRWAKVNDNASISLGVYTNGGTVMGVGTPLATISAPYHTNYTTGVNSAAGSDVLNSPIDIVPKLYQKQQQQQQQQMVSQSTTPDSCILTPQPKQSPHSANLSVVTGTNEQPLRSFSPKSFVNTNSDGTMTDSSPSRIYTTSPKLMSLPKTLMSRANSMTMSPTAANGMHTFLNASNRVYGQSRMSSNEGGMGLGTASPGPTANFPHSMSKLKYRTEVINKTSASCRVTFMPDELAVNILHCLYNDSQTASEPLLVFSNSELSIQPHNNVEIANTAPEEEGDGIAAVQRPAVKLEPIDVSSHTRHRKIEPIEIGDGSESSPIDDSEPDISTPGEYKTYKLITNEKQLQEASNFISSEERISGSEPSPKQAILLLPKGYAEEYNTNESASLNEELGPSLKTQQDIQQAIATQLNATSPSTSLSSATLQHNFDISMQDDSSQYLANHPQQQQQQQQQLSEPNHHHVPLNEQEVGVIDPMLGSQWQDKSSPTKSGTPVDTPTSVDSMNLVRGKSSGSDSTLSKTHSKPLPKDRPLPHPIRPRPKPSSSSTPKSTSERVFPKINVLIVEDNVINQAILGSFLRKHKISYKVAKNGKEAVDIWKEGGLHLIFMDLQLPVLSGIEAAKQIRNCEKERNKDTSSGRNSPPVIIVALTASNSIEDKRNALLSGCNDYLTKPVNLHWLSKKITEWGCMQALIDFDSWKQGQSRMTDSFLNKAPHKLKSSTVG